MNLKKVREQKGLSQTELANIFGVVRSTICQYEKGVRQPDITMLKRYSDFFNVSVDYLLSDDIWTADDYANGVRDTKKISITADEETWLNYRDEILRLGTKSDYDVICLVIDGFVEKLKKK